MKGIICRRTYDIISNNYSDNLKLLDLDNDSNNLSQNLFDYDCSHPQVISPNFTTKNEN